MRPPLDLHYTALTYLPCPYHFQQLKIRHLPQHDSPDALIGITGHLFAAIAGTKLYNLNKRRIARNIGHIKRLPNNMADQILDEVLVGIDKSLHRDIIEVVENFCVRFELHRGSEYIFERRMAVDRNYEPCSPVCEMCGGEGMVYHEWDEPVEMPADCDGAGEIVAQHCEAWDTCPDCHGTGLPPFDIVAGTADCIEITDGGAHARLTDYKMGWPDISTNAAITSKQLMLYAALYMWHNPDCRDVAVKLWGPRYNKTSEHAWDRETLLPQVKEFLEDGWKLADAMWEKYGESDWPAETANEENETACTYCELACPHEYWEEMYA